MGEAPILSSPWPADLDLATVPFKQRTVTILKRMGFFDDPSRLNGVTADDVASWWNSGPVTVEDLRSAGNQAILGFPAEAAVATQIESDLATVRTERWARHIWYADPRFSTFLPKGTDTVQDVATSDSVADRRHLWEQLPDLRRAVERQADLPLALAVEEYVEAVSGQHADRLDVLLARTGLNGSDPISAAEAADRLGVTHQRIYQIVDQMDRKVARARPLAGIWMPQIRAVELSGWPSDFAPWSIGSIRTLFTTGGADPAA